MSQSPDPDPPPKPPAPPPPPPEPATVAPASAASPRTTFGSETAVLEGSGSTVGGGGVRTGRGLGLTTIGLSGVGLVGVGAALGGPAGSPPGSGSSTGGGSGGGGAGGCIIVTAMAAGSTGRAGRGVGTKSSVNKPTCATASGSATSARARRLDHREDRRGGAVLGGEPEASTRREDHPSASGSWRRLAVSGATGQKGAKTPKK